MLSINESKTSSRHTTAKGGFTLVELLVVIGIIALLISILLPSLNSARQSATKIKCLSNLRSMGQATLLYANSNKDFLPPGIRYLGVGPDQNGYANSLNTNWSLVLQGMLSRRNASNYTDVNKNSNVLNDMSRALFNCPEAPTPTNKATGLAITNNLSYACHPLFFGGLIGGDFRTPSTWNSPNGGDNSGGFGGVMKPYKVGSIKRSSESILITDCTVYVDGSGYVMQVYDNPGLYRMDGALMAKTGSTGGLAAWNLKTVFQASNLDAAHSTGNSVDMTAVSNVAADCNTDRSTNYHNIRFRHTKNTVANALMADGHAESFMLNKAKVPNDPQKTNLLRKYIYQ